ncbi:PRTRC system protein B [Methylomonas sp. AM2-LC]|uniref:PRTRC system protein B n=1 Tax=Methylomonas sp. AM2-LC TaxID=3153301 RepID=UPI003266D717
MNDLNYAEFHDEEKPRISPNKAILIHSASGIETSPAYNPRSHFLASIHDFVFNEKNQSVIGTGQLLTENDLEQMLIDLLDKKHMDNDFISPNIISMSSRHIAWTIAGKVRPMIFRLRGENKTFKINVPWPNMLVVARSSGQVAIAAIGNNRRPNANTKVYRAPLMNIYDDGRVCVGSAAIPDGVTQNHISEWESIIFDTAFSHINNQKTLNLTQKSKSAKNNGVSDKDHVHFWRKLEKSKAIKFPIENLSFDNWTAGNFVSRHI